jgi:hypothetical protein
MNTDVIQAIMPALVAGAAVQQLLELIDSVLAGLFGSGYEQQKASILGILGIVLGVAVSYFGNVTMLSHLGVTLPPGGQLIDTLVTGVFISTGSAGANSVLKFLNYAKEGQKASAATVKATAARTPFVHLVPNAMSLVDTRGAQAVFGPGLVPSLVDGVFNLVRRVAGVRILVPAGSTPSAGQAQ